MEKKKTISGALHSIPNLEHNSRQHQPENADINKRWRNTTYVDGTDAITLEQTYEKLFGDSYQEWRQIQIKKCRGDRCPPTYLEKIQADKQKKPIYEVIFQIGDMMDTGYERAFDDAKMAELLLDHFIHHLLSKSYVDVITREKLIDKNWKPDFDNGIIIQNLVLHADESTPHIHFTFIPYSRTCRRGSAVQNAFSEAFRGMGYVTEQKQAVDKEENPVWQTDKEGNKVPQMKRCSYGAVDWIEEQKAWLAEEMKSIEWDRLYKGKNPRGNLKLSDYRREQAEINAREAEKKLEEVSQELKSKEEKLQQTKQTFIQAEIRLFDTKEEILKRKQKLQKTDILLTDKKKDLSEITQKAEIAEEAYKTFICFDISKQDMVEEIINLRYENGKLKEENSLLKQKLQHAYDFMKKITIDGMNLLERFMRQVKEAVCQIVKSI